MGSWKIQSPPGFSLSHWLKNLAYTSQRRMYLVYLVYVCHTESVNVVCDWRTIDDEDDDNSGRREKAITVIPGITWRAAVVLDCHCIQPVL